MSIYIERLGLFLLFYLLVACADTNDHFCAKYSYYYQQLQQPGKPPYQEMLKSLDKKIANGDESAIMMKFVLYDFRRVSKPTDETAKAFCMRRQLWQQYGN